MDVDDDDVFDDKDNDDNDDTDNDDDNDATVPWSPCFGSAWRGPGPAPAPNEAPPAAPPAAAPQPPGSRPAAGGFPGASPAARQLGRRPRAAGARGGSGSSSARGGRVPRAEWRGRRAVRTGGEASPGAALAGGPAAGERRLRQRLRRDPARRRRPGGHRASGPGSHLGVGAAARRRPCALELLLKWMVSCPGLGGVVRLLDWFELPDGFALVMERPERCRDLWHLLEAGGSLAEPVARGLFRQVLQAVRHCTSRGVLHCDIKAENILVDLATGEAKLIFFGCGTILQDTFYTWMERKGTTQEWILFGCFHGQPATIWSLGILLYLLVCDPGAQQVPAVRVSWRSKKSPERFPAAVARSRERGPGDASAGSRELWREWLRAPRPVGEVLAQCGEVALEWKRGNIPLQLNGIVVSLQAEAQLACSCGARRGAGEPSSSWPLVGQSRWALVWPLPGGHALHPDEIKMSPQLVQGRGDARASRHGRARPGHAPQEDCTRCLDRVGKCRHRPWSPSSAGATPGGHGVRGHPLQEGRGPRVGSASLLAAGLQRLPAPHAMETAPLGCQSGRAGGRRVFTCCQK
ncbi:uncharacterized protein LOC130266035 [Oenanthe melanoleuca]|uniref:uncharacterized protein LOC130266035 n=1 Tax=Oenanthe melanoleuca TaxID=2939378 RepID=UPI0024C16E4C|nr:uncharacterized protein LOC130266035 [Oenanthe melanoleuca]